jgi:hypothetical protein
MEKHACTVRLCEHRIPVTRVLCDKHFAALPEFHRKKLIAALRFGRRSRWCRRAISASVKVLEEAEAAAAAREAVHG